MSTYLFKATFSPRNNQLLHMPLNNTDFLYCSNTEGITKVGETDWKWNVDSEVQQLAKRVCPTISLGIYTQITLKL